MGFAGNLRTLSLGEVLQTLARIQATGALRLASADGGRDIVFDKGAIIGIAFRSGERRQALLKRLIVIGKLDASSAAGLSATGSESQVAKAIVEQGLVSSDDVSAAYEQQARDELDNIATWEYADFVFEDAGAGNTLADDLVERYRKHPIAIDMNHLLIESARRADEWGRLCQRIPDARVVYSAAHDAEFGLREMKGEYPGSAVVPLFDGVRTVSDVVAETVATRLDVYDTLVQMIDRRLVQLLGRDDLLRNVDHLMASDDFARAARLCRHLLSAATDDAEIGARLASCLEHLGDPLEAGASWTQIALQHLAHDNVPEATTCARHAVELAPERADGYLALVRCLVAAGATADAVIHLRLLAALYLRLGQLEDARGTCLKILELAPDDDEARRALARIFSRGDQEAGGEDAVVCVRCGEVNQREAKTCGKCKASLQLSCLACGRIVGVSDRLCIFCGADPHDGAARREPSAGVGTARLIKTDRVVNELKGTGHWREKLGKAVADARAHEAAGELELALAGWREVARWQTDSSELQSRIRDLEFRINDRFIALEIETGNRLRKGRRFWAAQRCYRRALRSMPVDDPRRDALRQIATVTARHQRRNGIVYGAAAVVLVALGFLVAQPHLQLRALRRQAVDARALIETLRTQGAAGVAAAGAAVHDLDLAADHVHGKPGAAAQELAEELQGELIAGRADAARAQLDRATAALDQQDLDGAAALLDSFGPAFGADESPNRVRLLAQRLVSERQRHQQADLLVKDAPKRLAKAQEHEAAGAPAEALALYRSLTSAPDPAIAARADEGVKRLEPQERALAEAFTAAAALAAKDLSAADAAYAALVKRAAPWGRTPELEARRTEIAARLAGGADDYARLGDQPALGDLTAFLAAHPGTPQAEKAAARLAVLRQQQTSRDQALARYHALMDGKKWPDAWQAARDLVAIYGRLLKPDEVAFPLLIETAPADASVTVGGHVVGRTPFLLTYLPAQDGEITLALAGWRPHAFHLRDAAKDWRLQVALARQVGWRAELKRPVTALAAVAGGAVAALTAEAAAQIDAKGAVAWTHALAIEDAGEGRAHAHHQPLGLPDGALAVAPGEHGLALLDRAGQPLRVLETAGEVRGRPALYTNDVFGTQQRLAFAAEALFSGQLGEPPARQALPAPAIAGPLALAKDLDRLLVVADARGHLVAIEESTRRQAWDVDLQAADCGSLVPASAELVVMVLDGSRVAGWRCAGDGAEQRWKVALGEAASGDPVVAGGRVLVAAGSQVVRIGLDGTPAAPLPLPAAAVANVAAAGDLVAAACQDGTVHLFRGTSELWSTPLTARATALAFQGETLIVGQADGAVVAFAP